MVETAFNERASGQDLTKAAANPARDGVTRKDWDELLAVADLNGRKCGTRLTRRKLKRVSRSKFQGGFEKNMHICSVEGFRESEVHP